MESHELHTYTLENLFGPMHNKLIRQDDELRMVHLMDEQNISRTLGIVRFKEIDGKLIEKVHFEIAQGEMLGKTLLEHEIDFDKEFIGARDIELPEWLLKEFHSDNKYSKAFFSRIWVNNSDTGIKELYAEIIEAIPFEISNEFPSKKEQLLEVESVWEPLLRAAKIKLVSYEKGSC